MLNENLSIDFSKMTLSEIVTRNFRAAAVFEKYSLDFCCGGNVNLESACKKKNVNHSDILLELESLKNAEPTNFNFDDWAVGFLSDYIVNNHHNYVRKMIPVISAHTEKIASVHGKKHPELIKIAHLFEMAYKDLKLHMMKEEEMLFPFIKNMDTAKKTGTKIEKPFFGTIKNPIKMMEIEHQSSGDELAEIRNLSNGYLVPDDSCNTYQAAFFELREFEEDLHKHVFLENSILFPKAIKLEEELFVK